MSTKKVNLDNDWKLENELRNIVNRNCEVIPYEGTEVNREGIVKDFLNYLKENHYSLLKHEKS